MASDGRSARVPDQSQKSSLSEGPVEALANDQSIRSNAYRQTDLSLILTE